MQDRDRRPPNAGPDVGPEVGPESGFDDLDALFSAARTRPVVPPEALMGRVMADALALQPVSRAFAVAPPAQPVPQALWRSVVDFFGGMGALAGMGSAAAAGLFIGFAQPVGLSDLSATLIGGQIDSLSLMPSVDDLITEVTP